MNPERRKPLGVLFFARLGLDSAESDCGLTVCFRPHPLRLGLPVGLHGPEAAKGIYGDMNFAAPLRLCPFEPVRHAPLSTLL